MDAEQMEYYKAKYQTLEDLPGVGPATASKLKEIGFRTVESVATAAVAELVSRCAASLRAAQAWTGCWTGA
jgi:DNA repair protein RadA